MALADRAGALRGRSRRATLRGGRSRQPADRRHARAALERCHAAVAGAGSRVASFERQTLRTITADQKRQILQLAGDFPKLWTAPTTTARDRKRMLRLLVQDITVAKGPEPKTARLQIRWQGGATETVELQLPPNRAEAVRYSEGS